MAYGEPDWAAPGAATSGAPGAPADTPPVNTGAPNTATSKDRSKLVQALISLLLIGLCAAMTALGVFSLMKNRQIRDFPEWFIATYMIIFSVLLFLYELMWWCTVGSLNRLIRKNFGFMYKIHGKALYLILVACLCIGISSDVLRELDWLKWFTGIAWGATGVLLLFLQITAPHIFESYQSPTAGLVDPLASTV